MTTENKGGIKPADQGGEASSSSQGNPKGTEEIKKLQEQVSALTTKLETVSRQYTGSTSEALRLKKELEETQSALEEARSKSSGSDKELQEMWETDQGGAVQRLMDTISSLATKVDALFTDRAQQAFDGFKAKHPGLKGEVLDAFNRKLKDIESIYSDPEKAMADAFKLVDGDVADRKAAEDARKAAEVAEANRKSQEQGSQVIDQSSVAESGNRNASAERAGEDVTKLEQELEALRSQAAVNSLSGQDDVRVLVRMQEVEEQLAKLKKK